MRTNASLYQTIFIDYVRIHRRLVKILTDIVEEEARESVRLLESVSRQFSAEHRPAYGTKTGLGRSPLDGADALWGMGGVKKGHGEVMNWLGAGTEVRYRVMSLDFVPRTRPGGGLNVGPKVGGPVAWGVRPGIKERNFIGVILRRRRTPFGRKVRASIQRIWTRGSVKVRKIV